MLITAIITASYYYYFSPLFLSTTMLVPHLNF